MLAQSYLATNEKLILLVKERPMIYDPNTPRDNQMLKNTWASIATAMGDDTVNAEGWKSKWRNIKDSYMRKKRQTMGRRRPAYENRREWPFMGMLTFLDNHISNRRRRGRRFLSVDAEDDDSEAGCLVDISDNERSVNAADYDVDNVQLLDEENHLENAQDPAKQTRDQVSLDEDDPESIVNSTDYTQEYGESNSYEDPDGNDAFFRSCSCRINNFTQQAQSLLRLQITQLFFNAENPDIPDLEITTLPPKPTSSGKSNTDTG